MNDMFTDDGDFKYVEDEEEFLEYYRKRKIKIVILVISILIIVSFFVIALILAKNPYDNGLVLRNDFENLNPADYYR